MLYCGAMELSWLGHACFRIRTREAIILTDPCPKSAGYSLGRPTADIVTISSEHPDHSYVAGVAGTPLVFWGPGEYESAGVLVTGVPTQQEGARGKGNKNTAYLIEAEGLRVCHLGRLDHVLTSEQAEEISGADILLIPVGGDSLLDAAAALETVTLLEPKVVVPMAFATPAATGKLDGVDKFLREMGATAAEPLPRLSINHSSLPDETQVSILDYKH